MPMDRATLPRAKSTISRCKPSVSPGNKRRLIVKTH